MTAKHCPRYFFFPKDSTTEDENCIQSEPDNCWIHYTSQLLHFKCLP